MQNFPYKKNFENKITHSISPRDRHAFHIKNANAVAYRLKRKISHLMV